MRKAPRLRSAPALLRRKLSTAAITPDRFSNASMGMLSNELGSGLSAATLEAERQDMTSHLWDSVRNEAQAAVESSHKYAKHLHEMLQTRVLPHESLADAISTNLAKKLGGQGMPEENFKSIFSAVLAEDPSITYSSACDLHRYVEIDPAADGHLSVFLFFKGFQAVQCARIAHHLWLEPHAESKLLARMLQCRMSHTFGVDIHPGADLGRGVTLDHATGVVIGETAVVGNNVGFMHDVTLGATGKSPDHDRHPKVHDGAFLSAKCTVLGNIIVGAEAIVAANALVNKEVPPRHTAMGVPAKMVPMTGRNHLPLSDPMIRWSESMGRRNGRAAQRQQQEDDDDGRHSDVSLRMMRASR